MRSQSDFERIKFEFDGCLLKYREISRRPWAFYAPTFCSYTMYYFTFVYICARHTHTLSRMIEDAAMKDERGDDVPDNESNEWEVGRERLYALPKAEVYSPLFTEA